ncbi:hypothetical protein ACN28S_51235 [Cystobacter fuscus]
MESIEEGGRPRAWARVERWVLRLLALTNRLRLPGPSVLPVAGALVGLYSGLAAGLFANLIGLVSGMALGFPKLLDALDAHSPTRVALRQAFAEARWQWELLFVGIPLGLSALVLSRLIQPGGPRSR